MHDRIEEWHPEERRLLPVSETPVLTSDDRISVEDHDGTVSVTYDADLTVLGTKLPDIPALPCRE